MSMAVTSCRAVAILNKEQTMTLEIEVLRPVAIVVPVECGVAGCTHDHERLLDFNQFTVEDTMLYLCRKHYEDFT